MTPVLSRRDSVKTDVASLPSEVKAAPILERLFVFNAGASKCNVVKLQPIATLYGNQETQNSYCSILVP